MSGEKEREKESTVVSIEKKELGVCGGKGGGVGVTMLSFCGALSFVFSCCILVRVFPSLRYAIDGTAKIFCVSRGISPRDYCEASLWGWVRNFLFGNLRPQS